MPSSSSARRRSESVRGLMPASERSSSQKRLRPGGEVADQQQRPFAADQLGGVAHGTRVVECHVATLPTEAPVNDGAMALAADGSCARRSRRARTASAITFGSGVNGTAGAALGVEHQLEVVRAGGGLERVLDLTRDPSETCA